MVVFHDKLGELREIEHLRILALPGLQEKRLCSWCIVRLEWEQGRETFKFDQRLDIISEERSGRDKAGWDLAHGKKRQPRQDLV